MRLLDEIIDAAVDEKVPIGTLLRKCLVLEQQVKNEKFRAWLGCELDGYDQIEELPPYRVFNCVNKGLFIGHAMRVDDQPISLHVMEEKDRKLIEKVYLYQPAASYEGRPNKSADSALPWNPSLTAKYQTKFFEDSDLVLNPAWQEIPGSVLVGLLEQIRTRVLRFALELKDSLPPSAGDSTQLSPAVVESSVVNHIYGGNILIASNAENISQIAHTTITVGDIEGLKRAFSLLGLTEKGMKELEADIKADETNGQPIGPRIRGWLANVGQYLGKEGAKAGIDVIKKLATKWILQYYGMDLG